MKHEPTPLRIASPWGMGIWKRRKNSCIGSPGSPGIWGSCIWVRTGAVVVLMLTTAGPFCSTRALKSGSVLVEGWTDGVWAWELEMGTSLPPSYPSATAAHTTSIRTNFFLDMADPSGLYSVTRLGQRMRGEVPVAQADTFCYQASGKLLETGAEPGAPAARRTARLEKKRQFWLACGACTACSRTSWSARAFFRM